MQKFQNQYRIGSCRLKKWDYANTSAYFITICTQNRHHFFGQIINKQMVYSPSGLIAQQCWANIPHHFPNITLDPFVIMPDHMHGILIIHSAVDPRFIAGNIPKSGNIPQNDINHHSQTSIPGGITGVHNPMLNESISRVIRWYKGRCSYEIKKTGIDHFAWQPRFYDHVIRDQKSRQNIRTYIEQNPMKWCPR